MERSRSGNRPTPWHGATVLLLVILLTACDSAALFRPEQTEMPVPPTEVAAPLPTEVVPMAPTQDDAEYAAFVYWSALGHQQYAVARNLLTPELQARTSEADLAASVACTEAVGLVVVVPMSITANRIIYQGIVSARTIPDVECDWDYAANTRYLELVKTPLGWRINKVQTEAIPINS